MAVYEIEFSYKDSYSKGCWSSQSAVVHASSEEEAIKACKDIYGLDIDPTCEYHILSVEEKEKTF